MYMSGRGTHEMEEICGGDSLIKGLLSTPRGGMDQNQVNEGGL